MVVETTIGISNKIKKILNNLKITQYEPYNSVIERVLLTSSLTGGTI